VTAPETLRRRSPLRFYLLVCALSIPFWLAGAVLLAHRAEKGSGVLTAVAAGVALGGMGRRRGAAR
jgi:hypothetical protein